MLPYLITGVLIGMIIAAMLRRPAPQRKGDFLAPSGFERAFSRFFGALIRLGLSLPHNYVLEVRGRKSGRIYTAPIDLLELDGRRYLVCPRGRAQWVRNAEAAGKVALVRARRREEFAVIAVPDADKPVILKNYLDRFKTTVQRYFPVPARSDAEAFKPLAHKYAVFELTPSA